MVVATSVSDPAIRSRVNNLQTGVGHRTVLIQLPKTHLSVAIWRHVYFRLYRCWKLHIVGYTEWSKSGYRFFYFCDNFSNQ